MRSATHIFSEDVAGIDLPPDMAEVNLLGLDAVTNSAVLEVDVEHALGACAL